ncbi:hypothetical protein FOZ61_010620, partial [Perkinsus olseni]
MRAIYFVLRFLVEQMMRMFRNSDHNQLLALSRMVISPRFFAAILFVLVPSNIGRTVSFSSQEWVLPIDDICDMFSRGVDKFYLEGATLLSSGSIYSQVKNDTMVNEIADCAR